MPDVISELTQYLKDSVSIDSSDVNGEFLRVSSDYAFLSERLRMATEEYLTLKLKEEQLASQLRLEFRATASQKLTESHLGDMVECTEIYQKLREQKLKAESKMSYLKNVLQAVKMKSEMLVSYGAQVRKEMSSDVLLRVQD